MDTAGVERVDFNALGGADLVTVNDLTGTDVNRVNVDLAGTLGGAAGDGQADRVIVNGTNGNDAINVSGDAQAVKVSGLAATIEILHAEVANDRLDVNTLAGRDTVGLTAAWPPVRSSSSWTACSSCRGSTPKRTAGSPALEAPPNDWSHKQGTP